MLPLLGVFLGLIIILALVKAEIVRVILHTSHRISGQPHIGIWLYALLFFPGTILHELAHFFAAEFLRVKTSEIHLLPRNEEQYVQLGYVTVAKADVFRSFLIGTAPFVVGLVTICLLVWFSFHHIPTNNVDYGTFMTVLFQQAENPVTWLIFYLLIVCSHAMFLSRADLREIYLLPIVVCLLAGVGYLFRQHIPMSHTIVNETKSLMTILDVSLGIVLLFNIIFLFVIGTIKKIFDTIF